MGAALCSGARPEKGLKFPLSPDSVIVRLAGVLSVLGFREV